MPEAKVPVVLTTFRFFNFLLAEVDWDLVAGTRLLVVVSMVACTHFKEQQQNDLAMCEALSDHHRWCTTESVPYRINDNALSSE